MADLEFVVRDKAGNASAVKRVTIPVGASPVGTRVSTVPQLLQAIRTPNRTVLIDPGTYLVGWDIGWIMPAAGVRLTATDPSNPPTLDGGDENGGAVVQIVTNNVTLDNLIITCSGTRRVQPADNDWSDWVPAAVSVQGPISGTKLDKVQMIRTGNGLFAGSEVLNLVASNMVAKGIGWYSTGKGRETGYACYVQGLGVMDFDNWDVSEGHSRASHVYGGEQVKNGNKHFTNWKVRGPLGCFGGGGDAHLVGMIYRNCDIQVGGQPIVAAYGWTGSTGLIVEGCTLSTTFPSEACIALANNPADSTIHAYPGDPTGGSIKNNRYHGGALLDRQQWGGMVVSGNTQF